MAFDFPSSPTVGQVSNGYIWDGEKWQIQSTVVGSVRYDSAQSLTEAQQIQARANIAAAPLVALQASNIAINGGMVISQERTVNVTAPQSTGGLVQFADMYWQMFVHASAAITGYNGYETGSPGIFPPPGFTNCIAMYGGTAPTTLANNDNVVFHHKIEGTRFAKLGWGAAGAKPITVSFMFFTNDPGVGFFRVANYASTRFYHAEFNAPINGWNFITVVVPGEVSAGVWAKDNTTAAYINIYVAGKSASPVAPNAWSGTGAFQTTNSQNLIRSNTTTVGLTGMLILPGAVTIPDAATLALLMRPWAEELTLCRRYLNVLTGIGGSTPVASGICYNTTLVIAYFQFPVQMRIGPAFSTPNVAKWMAQIAGNTIPLNGLTLGATSPISVRLDAAVPSGLTTGQPGMVSAVDSTAYMMFDARLA